MRPPLPATLLPALLLTFSLHSLLLAQEESNSIVDFGRDVRPIFAAKCIECHGPDEAKNDWRADEEDSVISYVEAGDLESSSLWADYLRTDDEDMHMPPVDKPQLTAAELATVKLWIEEGASWSEVAAEGDEEPEEEDFTTRSVVSRAFEFQGLFHPASVHFPVALLTCSTVFLLLAFFWPSFEPAAFHCLWVGAIFAVLASVMGWGYAVHEGYGAGYSFSLDKSIDRHRWAGIAVAVLALILVPMARSSVQKSDKGMKFLWLFGSLFLLAGVSIAGYQGGELTYGEDHYEAEFNRLFPEAATESVEEAPEDGAEEDGALGGETAASEDEGSDGQSLDDSTEDSEDGLSI